MKNTTFQHAARILGTFLLCASLFPIAAYAQATPASNDALNARMREAARTASKQKSLNELMAPHLPAIPLHSEFLVEINKKGQVTRIRSGKNSKDSTFDLMTYGNALQAYIRAPDGHADVGTYRMVYDYSPVTHKVSRDAELVSLGGVNPNALGAVYSMAHDQAAGAHKSPLPAAH